VSELSEFMLARLDEAEAEFERALVVEAECSGVPVDEVREYWLRPKGQGRDEVERAGTGWPRYLADIEAKRRIVELHTPFHVTTENDGLNWDYQGCGECSMPDGVEEGETWWPCETLRLLALPYADHPDFDERWSL